ncbi:MAG TPA: DUF892 family protein [Chloroflexia bacterium]|nr:DUF892 family protein [Chloroflexia bacterium]
MADAKTVLQKYVSDMISLEGHIFQAIDKQVKENKDDPEVQSHFQTFSKTVEQHRNALQARLNALGGAANQPVKEGVSAVMGVAAGVIDKMRSEERSKDFRDDYTALNLSLISYEMLHTTALALNDRETADLAARNVRDNADFVMWIQRVTPRIVLKELQENHDVTVNNTALQETDKLISDIWK